MKTRNGNWRVVRNLAAINLAVWVSTAVIIGAGLVRPPDSWWLLTIDLPFMLMMVAYLNLYQMPKKKGPQSAP